VAGHAQVRTMRLGGSAEIMDLPEVGITLRHRVLLVARIKVVLVNRGHNGFHRVVSFRGGALVAAPGRATNAGRRSLQGPARLRMCSAARPMVSTARRLL